MGNKTIISYLFSVTVRTIAKECCGLPDTMLLGRNIPLLLMKIVLKN